MPRTAKSFADEIQELWARADAEGRDLTPAERIHMSELVSEAKSQDSTEKQIREIGGGAFSTVVMTDPNHSFAGGGPGDGSVSKPGARTRRPPAAVATTTANRSSVNDRPADGRPPAVSTSARNGS